MRCPRPRGCLSPHPPHRRPARDLTASLRRIDLELREGDLRPVLAALIDRAEWDPEIRDIRVSVAQMGSATIRTLLKEAIEREELQSRLDPAFGVTQLIGPLLYRQLLRREAFTPGVIKDIVAGFREACRTPGLVAAKDRRRADVPTSQVSVAAERRWHAHRQATRANLEEVAIRLVSENGFAAVTVDDITGACGVSRRTFFRCFRSKDDVVLAAFTGHLDQFRSALSARPPAEPLLSAVASAFGCVADRCVEPYSTTLTCLRVIASSRTVTARSELIHHGWHQGMVERLAEGSGAILGNSSVWR